MLLQWHSADCSEWQLVEPSTGDAAGVREPSDIKYEVDELPPVACHQDQDDRACGIWFRLDSGWVWGLGPETQGGAAIPIFASADGVNWEEIETDVPGWGAIGEAFGANHIQESGWAAWTGVGWFVRSAENIAIMTAYLASDDPHDTPAPAWYWVTELP